MIPTPARSRGFTLLEILVAIGVFAIFSALAYGALNRVLDSRDRIETERAFWRQLALAFAQMEDDLAMARKRPIRNVFGVQIAAFSGQPVDSRAQGEPSLAFTRGGVFVLAGDTRPDLQRVGYRLTDNKLMRLTWPALDQPTQIEPQPAVVLDHVTDLKLRFYVDKAGWVGQWPQPGTPVSQLHFLPAAVEVTLSIEGRGEFQRVLRVNG